MRKILSLGLLALILSSVSAALLAGYEVCDNPELKDDLKDAGVYGWCNAWFDPEQTNKGHIEDMIRQRVEKFENETGRVIDLSWLVSAVCPCWSEEYAISIATTNELIGCGTGDFGAVVFDYVYYKNGANLSSIVDYGFEPAVLSCFLGGITPEPGYLATASVTIKEDQVCRSIIRGLESSADCTFTD